MHVSYRQTRVQRNDMYFVETIFIICTTNTTNTTLFLTFAGRYSVSSLASWNVNLNVLNRGSLCLGKEFNTSMNVDERSSLLFREAFKSGLAFFLGLDESGRIPWDIPKSLCHLDQFTLQDCIFSRSNFVHNGLCLSQGGGVDGVLDFHGNVCWRD